ncbi:MAG: site-specific integrase [Balneola sp.]
MASLIKQHGLYYLQFYNTKRRPIRKRIALKTRTKNTALKLKRKLEDEFAIGAFDPWLDDTISIEGEEVSKDSTIKEALDHYIKVKSKKDWRPNTAKNAKYVLEDFVRRIGNELLVGGITEGHFNTFLNRSDIKYETKRSHRKKLKTFLIWLDENNLAKLNSKKLHVNNDGGEQEESINYFTKEDIEKLTSYISGKVAKDLQKGFQKKKTNALWLIDFIHWQRLSGMRLSETLNLRANDINTDTWEITIGNAHFVTKSKKKQVLPIQSVEPLKQIARSKLAECSSEDDRLFGHSCRRHTNRLFNRYLKKALPNKSYLNIHSLRHTCCIELLRAGVPIYTVQRWLRHADVKTTQRYADLLNMDISEQVGKAINNYPSFNK